MPKTILFLAASPNDQAYLRSDKEQREIQEHLKRSMLRNEFNFVSQLALRYEDLINVLREMKPWAVHFSGHGTGATGLLLEDDAGKTAHLANDLLNSLFYLLKGHTHFVMLSACYSEKQAKIINQHIPYVVGMNAAVLDTVATQFAQQFYSGLGAGETIERAFYWAKLGVRHVNRLGANVPVLYQYGQLIEQEPLPKPPDLETKQHRFVTHIFESYIELNYPVMILAQQGFPIQHYLQALKQKAQRRFALEQVLHIVLPVNNHLSEAEYFSNIAKQCALPNSMQNSTAWHEAMRERLQLGRELCLFITGFEQGSDQYRRMLAGELRSLLSIFAYDLKLVLVGGERLAALKHEFGKLSFLSGIEEEPLPTLCVEDVKAFYLKPEANPALTDEALQSVLEFSGQHPRLVQACVRELEQGNADWQIAVKNSAIPAQLFGQVRHEAQLAEYLQRSQFGRNDTWSQDALTRKLYWQNLLKPQAGCLVWRCEWLRAVGKELLAC